MREEAIRFGQNPELEGKWGGPETPHAALVFSHPHPLYGGDMDNNVVRLVCHHLNRSGVATLRYNFRGVGGSEGTHDGGAGECADVEAAIQEARRRAGNALPLFLAGYSFGSFVNWQAAGKPDVFAGEILISPPLDIPGFRYPPRPSCATPVLIFLGDRDDFCSLDQGPSLRALAPSVAMQVFEGVDHFWTGREKALAENILGWLSGILTAKK